ncbi:filamentous hemagglutinin N-terminal domain-containing protein [Orbaceae bacterium ESL0727]|nr:filamentous hemagglutinin N-terminal domain-containing protein [Orbaceae bacterium ESL0727]
MNKHFYRVVFNRTRRMLMVVAEIAKAHNGESAGEVAGAANLGNTTAPAMGSRLTVARLSTLTFATYLALGLVAFSSSFISSSAVASTIKADTSAPKNQQPIIIPTANGATQVNIKTPNKNGLSHNKYSQFDVSDKGVILNNATKNSKTQLAGYIQGNAFLKQSGGAKIILNEVNSQNPSQLNGYIEVAGQKAQVVIANAAGITCRGCGFINAERSTLTTGVPVILAGQLAGYRVEQGTITVTGKGLDSSGQDYTDIIARAVSIDLPTF